MSKFICPHWRDGEICKPVFVVHWFWRLGLALAGISIVMANPVLTCIKAYSSSPPAAPIAIVVFSWAAVLAAGAIASVIITLYHEKDIWGTVVSSLGTPSVFTAFVTLPHLI